jgi:hypothetical protein
VTVTGTGFVSNPGYLVCRFGIARVWATFASASVVQCLSPAQATGAVVVAISNNNQDFTANSISYTYDRALAHLLSVSVANTAQRP